MSYSKSLFLWRWLESDTAKPPDTGSHTQNCLKSLEQSNFLKVFFFLWPSWSTTRTEGRGSILGSSPWPQLELRKGCLWAQQWLLWKTGLLSPNSHGYRREDSGDEASRHLCFTDLAFPLVVQRWRKWSDTANLSPYVNNLKKIEKLRSP